MFKSLIGLLFIFVDVLCHNKLLVILHLRYDHILNIEITLINSCYVSIIITGWR